VAQTYRDRRNPERQIESDARFRRFLDDDPAGGATGEYAPPMDVLETAESIEILLDVPGVPASGIRLLFSQGTLVIAGHKTPAVCPHREAAFHLAERSFGRFVRAVRLTGAIDAGRASATLSHGELRVVLPRIEERRGREIRIEISRS
jgi:HSP20 family protein